MNNLYEDYYKNQAGNGMTVYEGLQYQRGHGFFGSLFANIIKPLGKYLGKKAIETGVNLGSDMLQGDDFKESLKKNLKLSGNRIMEDSSNRLKRFAQTGTGRKRRKLNKKKKSSKKKSVIAKPSKRRIVKKKRKVKRSVKRKLKKKSKKIKKRSKKVTDSFKKLFD